MRGPCQPGTLLSSLPHGPSPFPSLCLHPCPDLWQPLPGSLSPPPAPFATSPPPKDAEIPGPPVPAQPSLRLGAGGDRQHLGPVASGGGRGRDDRYHSVLCFSREQRTKSVTTGLRDLSPTYRHCVCLASPGAGSAEKPRVHGWVVPAPATEYSHHLGWDSVPSRMVTTPHLLSVLHCPTWVISSCGNHLACMYLANKHSYRLHFLCGRAFAPTGPPALSREQLCHVASLTNLNSQSFCT